MKTGRKASVFRSFATISSQIDRSASIVFFFRVTPKFQDISMKSSKMRLKRDNSIAALFIVSCRYFASRKLSYFSTFFFFFPCLPTRSRGYMLRRTRGRVQAVVFSSSRWLSTTNQKEKKKKTSLHRTGYSRSRTHRALPVFFVAFFICFFFYATRHSRTHMHIHSRSCSSVIFMRKSAKKKQEILRSVENVA